MSVSDGKSSSGGDSDTLDAFITVTVTVTNAEEAGTVTLSSDMLIVGEAVTATVTDPDVVTTGTEMWQWATADEANGMFVDIEGATMASYTPVEADDGKYLRASVTYTDGEGPNKTASGLVAGDPLILRYDANGNMMIDRSEVLTAIYDYLFGVGDAVISKTEVIKLINLYLYG